VLNKTKIKKMYSEEDWDSDIRYAPKKPITTPTSFVQPSATSSGFNQQSSDSAQQNPKPFGRGRFPPQQGLNQNREKSREDYNRPTTSNNYSSNTSNHTSNYDRNNNNSYNKNNSNNSYDHQRSNSHKRTFEESTNNADTMPKIDWNAVRAQPMQNLDKFKDHPDVVKNFYVEDPEISAMTRDQVKEFRKENFNITVDVFKKEKPIHSITLAKAFVEDSRTPEEIEDYIFATIPKPVKTIAQAFSRFPEIIAECNRQNFKNPTPIQAQLWPILLKGLDCVGIAQTGTGKTLAFLLPALIHIDNQTTPRNERVGPNVLVLSPTRELAIQIEQEVKKINYKGIKSVCVYGGGDRSGQVNACSNGVQIIIATPGRLYDLVSSKVVNITSVTYLILDEADRMLDLGFEPQIMKLLLDIRPDRQTVMTSATWPEGVRRLATKYLNEPIQLYVGSLDLRAAKTVKQELVMTQSEDEKKSRLIHYIENEMSETDKLIVFVGRKSTADNLSCDLAMRKVQAQCIHGDREQCDREDALEDFKLGVVRILIATDVASRGIDVIDISCVLNYDFPRNIEDYVHRVGRTGRAGKTGTAITFMAREDWKHAKELIPILEQGEQEVPKSLVDMADRYAAMMKKKLEEGGGMRGGGGGVFVGALNDGCFKCGEKGHFSRECPKSGASNSGGGGFGMSRGGGGGGGFGGFISGGSRGGARGRRGRDDGGFMF
jgi:ATP-dependent RNA helicase DDX43